MGERTRELLLLIAGDTFCFLAALWLTLLVRYLELPTGERIDAHLTPFLILSAVWVLMFYAARLYDKHTVMLKSLLFRRILHTQVINIFIAAFIFWVVPFGIAPKTNLVIYLVVSIILITLWRLVIFNYFSPKRQRKAILIADGDEAVALADEINNNTRYDYSFARIFDSETIRTTEHFEQKLLELVRREDIEIIVANPYSAHIGKLLPAIFNLSFLRFEFTFLDFNKLYEDTFDHVPLATIEYDWFLNYVSQTNSFVYSGVKRAIDMFGALVLMVPCLALFPIVAALIKLQDRGPIFYRTERVGHYNRPIEILKFRTMTGMDHGASAVATAHVVTPLGKILRKTRIDELPQLVNVLRGDLSFIGPRPEMPALAEVYAREIPYYNARHFIKPGLSGWAQINNYDAPRGGVDIERTKAKLAYDLFYLRHRSLLLDLQIVAKTVHTILMRTGT